MTSVDNHLTEREAFYETPEHVVSRIHSEFGRGAGNSFKYVGPGGMWKTKAVLELMRLAYLEGRSKGRGEEC